MVGGLSRRVGAASSSLALYCRLAPIAGAGEHAPSDPLADPAPPRPSRAVGPFGSRGRARSRAG